MKQCQVKKLKKFNQALHLIALPNIENSWNHLFELVHKNATFTIVNKTSSEVILQYCMNYKNQTKGWNLLATEPTLYYKRKMSMPKNNFDNYNNQYGKITFYDNGI